MKKHLFHTLGQNATLMLIICGSLIFCTKKSTEIELPEPEKSCKIIGIVGEVVTKDQFGNITDRAVSEQKDVLNERFYPISGTSTSEFTQNGQLMIKTAYTYSWTLDQNDFLNTSTGTSEVITRQNNELLTEIQQGEATHKYSNQRLIETISKTTSGNRTVQEGFSKYEYAPDGKLLRYIQEYNGNHSVATYSNGIFVSRIESNPSSNMLMTYNAMGYVNTAKTTSYDGKAIEYRHYYDEKGNFLKLEMYTNNVLESYTEYTLGQADLQAKARPISKGHPVIPSTLGSSANLVTKSADYKRQQNSSNFVKTLEINYVYDFNSLGYITVSKSTGKSFDVGGNVIRSTESTATYSYTGCE